MNKVWKWDQGRLNYFQYNNLQSMARAIVNLDGMEINVKDLDPLRYALETQTKLPFSPQNYKVWRNYKRVFECSMLATNIDNHLFISDICKNIVQNSDFEVDDYLLFMVKNFRYPYPAFSEYNAEETPVYPFCAIIKYLISQLKEGKEPCLTVEETFSKIIGNNCDGIENINFYKNLPDTNRKPIGDEQRQVREMLIFISQMSILKWYNGKLWLDASLSDLIEYDNFEELTSPNLIYPNPVREKDFILLTSVNISEIKPFEIQSRELVSDDVFTEGKRIRVTHIKIERSPLLRKLYFNIYPTTTCNMCVSDTKKKYPWTDNLLEIHHILPLSSTLTVTSSGTSLEDIVPLCPTCHRGVHSYYRIWLNTNLVSDFQSRNEALMVYEQAKSKILL